MKKPHRKKSAPSSKSRFSEGQKLGGCYGLTQRLEGDGAAEVWRAFDDVLGKEVTLHFIPAEIVGDTEAMSALRQEVKRTRQLIHPNILRVYDLVEDEGWAAFSMDDFAGESLATKLANSQGTGLSVGALQPWLSQLFQTIDDAHKINVLHRDLTPANLLLGPDGKLLVKNFGISRVLVDAAARLSGKSAAARSPQQIGGVSASRLDDVYALGAVLFESLTGRLPEEGKDLSEQLKAARPKGAAVVPQSWVETIVGCLEKSPAARPQSAGAIGAGLETVGVEAAPETVESVPSDLGQAAVAPVEIAASSSETQVSTSGEMSAASQATDSPATPTEKKSEPDVSPSASAPKSRFPLLGLSVAVGLMIVGGVGYFSNHRGKAVPPAEPTAMSTPVEQSDEQEIRPVSNTVTSPLPTPIAAVVDVIAVPEIAPPVSAPAAVEPVQLAAVAAVPPAAVVPASPAPAAVALPVLQTDEEKQVVEKAAAVEAAKVAAQAAEKAHGEMTKKQQQVAGEVAAAEKALEQKTKAVGPVKKASDEVLAQLRKLEEEQKAASVAAEQARQLADEKARLAAVAQKAIGELAAKNKEKLAAQDKATAEIQFLEKALAEKQAAGTSVAKAASEAEATRQKYLAAIKQSELELEQAKLAAADARRLREEAEAERRKLAQELTDMQKMMEKKKAEIEDRLKKLEKAEAKPPVAAVVPETVKTPESEPVVKPATQATPPPVAPVISTPSSLAVLPKVPVLPPAATPPPATPPQMVMKTDPEKLPATPAPKSGNAPGLENSLGMKFVAVGDVEFCVWQTRVKDFEVFAKNAKVSSAWKSPGFKQGPDHPVVNVSWVEALAFCKWLTDQERKDGMLTGNQFYRLPTDVEWSKAVGLPDESGKTPEERDMGVPDVYPWGNQWPPPPKAGNYTGEETGSDVAIKGFDDGYPWTSPVGSFAPNKLGIFDMGGNVWQWCMDTKNSTSKAKVLRGASWYNGALKLSLLSSCRVSALPDSSTDNYGFRIVRAAVKK